MSAMNRDPRVGFRVDHKSSYAKISDPLLDLLPLQRLPFSPQGRFDLLGVVRGKDATDMQIATTMGLIGTLGTSAAEPRVVVPDVNRKLAEVRVRMFDRDDRVTFTSHLQLVSGGRVGASEGYATLREALGALADVTRGERPAAVVLERYGRFYGHTLKGRDLEEGLRAPLRRTYLEADDNAEVVELRAEDRFERVRALVDGDWSHRFRG
jgi:hypothetical protein